MSDLYDEDGNLDRTEVSRRAKSIFAVVLAFGILIGGGVFVAVKGQELYLAARQTEDYIGDGKDATTIVIPAGASVNQIGNILVRADVVRSAKAFRSAAEDNPKGNQIQPGSYNLKTKLPAATAVTMLLDPANKIVKRVTVPEGLRLSQIVPLLVDATGKPEGDYTALLTPPAATIGLPEYAGGNPEGMLFPDSYEIGDDPDPTALLTSMTTRYTEITTQAQLDARAPSVGMTPYQVIIVASIIEGEVRRDEDRAKVARVIYNRLEDGMPLQVDSSVNYGLNRTGHANLADGDTGIDTPYNTYMHAGLPPTPINSPGLKSIEAALSPADGNWLYWVSVNLDTGETKFADTYEQHQVNVAEYQKWCRDNQGKCTSR